MTKNFAEIYYHSDGILQICIALPDEPEAAKRAIVDIISVGAYGEPVELVCYGKDYKVESAGAFMAIPRENIVRVNLRSVESMA